MSFVGPEIGTLPVHHIVDALTAHPSLHPSMACSRAPRRIGDKPAHCAARYMEPAKAKIRYAVGDPFRSQGSRLPHP